jgi:hypothetical protein
MYLGALNTSLKAWYDFVLDTKNPNGRDALALSNSWVDVRDLAVRHIACHLFSHFFVFTV